jgi:1-deoxy-D-xylulose-5-phosphate synthase
VFSLNILENIHGHNDLVKLNEDERICLCQQIRDFLIESVSKTGGHLASNLGVVELTVALETVFDTETDRLVFDVGHQSYVHKLLTGRREGFSSLRQFGGMAGFPKPSESNTDAFTAGHSSSSVSIALGMARARSMTDDKYHVVALLGDGAATGGMVYEGLNDAAVSNEPMIVILNDNEMSIDNNVGGMASHLSKLRTKEKYLGMKRKYRGFLSHVPCGNHILKFTRNIKDMLRRMLIPETIFESMGFTYIGPVDGHDTENLIYLLRVAKEMNRPVLLHVITKKGKGFDPAEQHPKLFHGVGKFDPQTGNIAQKKQTTFSDAFGECMCHLAEQDLAVCAVTAAMPGGTGLLNFKKQYPDRMFDVGIAEEHAVSMAAGLAKQGVKPVVAIYSTFLQRSYDMILQDICMQKLHVVLGVDRAGLVGEDGETHHGVFDVGFLRQAPSMAILCPASCAELNDMMRWAVLEYNGPIAVRYPRGADGIYKDSAWELAKTNGVYCHKMGSRVAIITYGSLINNALEAANLLQKQGIDAAVLRLLTVSPLPWQQLARQLDGVGTVVIMEEVCNGSGIGAELGFMLAQERQEINFHTLDLGNKYITHGSMEQLYKHTGLDGCSVAEFILEVLKIEK